MQAVNLGAIPSFIDALFTAGISLMNRAFQRSIPNPKQMTISSMISYASSSPGTTTAFDIMVTQIGKDKFAEDINGSIENIIKSAQNMISVIPKAGTDINVAIDKFFSARGIIIDNKNVDTLAGILRMFSIDKLLNHMFNEMNPIKQLYKFFTHGKWLNTYQVPYFTGSNDILYLKSANAGKWDLNAGLSKIFGKTIAGKIQENSDMQYPVTPIFNSGDNSQNVFDSVTTTFYLINDNEENLVKNFKFLHSLFAGTQWILLKFGYRRAPNVYNVYCNSRFNYIWASIDMTVNSCGKVFRAPPSGDIVNNLLDSTILSNAFKNLNKSTLWPTAWQVTLTINSLVPNNFNTYLEFIYNGFSANTVITNTSKADSLNNDLLSDAGGLIRGFTNQVADLSRQLAQALNPGRTNTQIIIIFLNTGSAIILYVQAYFFELIYEYFLLIKSVIVF